MSALTNGVVHYHFVVAQDDGGAHPYEAQNSAGAITINSLRKPGTGTSLFTVFKRMMSNFSDADGSHRGSGRWY